MIASLSEDEKAKFSDILFHVDQTTIAKIEELTQDEKRKLKKITDQKIAYDMAHRTSHVGAAPRNNNPNLTDEDRRHPAIPNLITSICCCFYPQQNRDTFDITNEIFLKRFFGVFLFWKIGFLNIGGGRPDLFGPLWISLTYVTVMGLTVNMLNYFINQMDFAFSQDPYTLCIGVSGLFFVLQAILYPAVIRCLGGFLTADEVWFEPIYFQSICLMGYSIALYIFPTLACCVPSLYWHLFMLSIAAFMRWIFLFRNLSQKIDSKRYILLVVVLVVEALYFYITLKSQISKYSDYSFQSGFKQLNSSNSVLAHMLLNRHPNH